MPSYAPTRLPNVTTNYRPRDLVPFCELPAKVIQSGIFDYITAENVHSSRFVQYRGEWYDTGDCESWDYRATPDSPLRRAGWSGFWAETYFSAVVFAWFNDEEMTGDDWTRVVVGHYSA